jgi:hypothetical protein
MRKLADHIRQAHEDAEHVHTSSVKIAQRFAQIESVELEFVPPAGELLPLEGGEVEPERIEPERVEPERQVG